MGFKVIAIDLGWKTIVTQAKRVFPADLAGRADIRESAQLDKGFNFSKTFSFCYDESSGVAHFCFVGVD